MLGAGNTPGRKGAWFRGREDDRGNVRIRPSLVESGFGCPQEQVRAVG